MTREQLEQLDDIFKRHSSEVRATGGYTDICGQPKFYDTMTRSMDQMGFKMAVMEYLSQGKGDSQK